ncbi:hypothetical protein BaRGS_00009386 [Batillaria attramentaria]|uniref:Uncharacterized protein n=1 Tax=Batillaria attramentaria TaxID=370345 RepID=A0ABD0LJP2_9CAEN
MHRFDRRDPAEWLEMAECGTGATQSCGMQQSRCLCVLCVAALQFMIFATGLYRSSSAQLSQTVGLTFYSNGVLSGKLRPEWMTLKSIPQQLGKEQNLSRVGRQINVASKMPVQNSVKRNGPYTGLQRLAHCGCDRICPAPGDRFRWLTDAWHAEFRPSGVSAWFRSPRRSLAERYIEMHAYARANSVWAASEKVCAISDDATVAGDLYESRSCDKSVEKVKSPVKKTDSLFSQLKRS